MEAKIYWTLSLVDRMGGGDLIRGGGEGARNCLLVKLQRGKTFVICNSCAFNPSFIQCVGGVTTIAGYSYQTI